MFDKEIYVQRRAALKAKINTGIGLFMGNREAPAITKTTPTLSGKTALSSTFGLDEPDLAAVIDFETGREILFADDVSLDAIVWTGPLPKVTEKAERIGISARRSVGIWLPSCKKHNKKDVPSISCRPTGEKI